MMGGNLSFLYEENELFKIDQMMEAKTGKPRGYLGMSEIGDPCRRKLWFSFHKGIVPKFPANVLRMFRLGHYIEQTIIDDLRLAKFQVFGEQTSFSDFNNNFRGHNDGFVKGLQESIKTHLLELKSSNDKNFKLFQKHGYKDHPSYGEKYYGQIQCYMGYSKLDRSLVIIENKNDGKRYRERIEFSQKDFNFYRKKAKKIIYSKVPPKGISDKPGWFKCRYCNFNNEDYCRKVWKGEDVW